MRRARVWIALACLLVALPGGLILGLRLGLATPLVNLALRRELSGLFNGDVSFGSFRTNLVSYAQINDLLVLTKRGEGKLPVLTAGRIRLQYDGWRLLRGGRSLEDAVELLSIRQLKAFFLRDEKGRWNLRELLKLPGKKAPPAGEAAPPSRLPTLATRLVLEDSVLVFNDERKGFQSTIENVEGTLDARAFPLVAFSLSGRTEEQARDNLSLAGEYNADEDSLYARADLDDVPLKTYLNYALPGGGLQFLGGKATLSVRVSQASADADLDFNGRADVKDGSLAIPGIAEPLTGFQGAVVFGGDRLQVSSVQASFLGSSWQASGELKGLRSPELNLVLINPSAALSPLSEQIHGLAALHLSGTAALALTVTGKAVDPVAVGTLSAPWLGLAGIEFQDMDAHLRATKAGLKVTKVEGTLWKGRVQGSADLAFPKHGSAGRIGASLSAAGVELGLVRYKGVQYLPLTGTASLKASVEGALGKPKVSAGVNCPSAYFASTPLGPLTLDCENLGRSLKLGLLTWNGLLQADVGFDFAVSGSEFTPSKVQFRRFPLDALLKAIAASPDTALITPGLRRRMTPRLQSLAGTADMILDFSGPIRRPELALQVLRHDGRILMGNRLFAADDPRGLLLGSKGRLSFGKSGLGLGGKEGPFVLRLPEGGKGATASFSGQLALTAAQAKSQSLGVSLTADLAVLNALELCKKTKGAAELDLRLEGSLENLNASGWMQVKDFSSEMAHYFNKLKNGEAQLWIRDKVLTVENVSFDSGGSFEANGRLDFSAGLLPQGRIDAGTDSEGLRLDNFDYGDLMLELRPLILTFKGSDGMEIAGKAVLHDSVLLVRPPKAGPERPAGRQDSAAYPVSFDLRAEVQQNVWLKKIQEGVEFQFSDPLAMLRQTLNSAQETLRSPSFEFLFKPTENDFVIQGEPKDLRLQGELGIDRGTLIFMENEFKIRQETKANRVVFRSFNGHRGDVEAEAVAQIRYVREGAGGKLEPRTVRVTADIKPLDTAQLAEAHLENSFLNYSLEFSSDPPLSDNKAQERDAILSLLVLGDPLNESAREAIGSKDSGSSGANINQLLSTQVSRVLSGELRKVINRYAKFLGSNVVDYVRVAPQLRYRGRSNAAVSQSQASAQSGQVSQQIQDEGFRWSWLFELGRNIGRNVYTSAQVIFFGEDDLEASKQQTVTSVSKETRNYGARVTGEWRLSPTRAFELSYNYSTNENLEAVPFNPENLVEAHSVYFGLRNTIPTENYGPRQARERRLAQLERTETKP